MYRHDVTNKRLKKKNMNEEELITNLDFCGVTLTSNGDTSLLMARCTSHNSLLVQ